MPLLTTPAILLRAFAYGESSRILRFYARDVGTLGVMAKGIRKSGARGGSGLETFAGGQLTVYMSPTRELQTFKEFSAARPRRGLGAGALRLGAASLVGELVLRHAGEEANPSLFGALDQALDRIECTEDSSVLPVALSGAWRIVSVLGYHPVLESCVSCGASLAADEIARFDFSAGGLRCGACAREGGPRVGPGARAQLRALIAGEVPLSPLLRPRAHLRLLSDFVTHHVSGARPLDSFAFLTRLVSEDDG